jgi:acetyl-CoA acetyltransferase
MTHKIIIALALTCLFSAEINGQDLKSRIREAPRDHPRLILRRGEEASLRRKIESDPLLRRAAKHVTTTADAIRKLKPVERKKVGRRLLGISWQCQKRVLYLSLAYRVTGDRSYAERAQEEMLAAAGFNDWNPSHFLDVAEMTAALAIGYDWLY